MQVCLWYTELTPNTRKESMRTWRRRIETLGVLGEHAKRNISVYISVNKNTNFNFLKIIFIYTIWNGLSLKTNSRYCPFKSFCLRRLNDLQRTKLSCGRMIRLHTRPLLPLSCQQIVSLLIVKFKSKDFGLSITDAQRCSLITENVLCVLQNYRLGYVLSWVLTIEIYR